MSLASGSVINQLIHFLNTYMIGVVAAQRACYCIFSAFIHIFQFFKRGVSMVLMHTL